MTIEIPLTKGYTAIVDDADKDLAELKWHTVFNEKGRQQTPYAKRGGNSMHRLVLERVLGRKLLTSERVDHVNGDGLLNTRSNLRLATSSQNNRNSRQSRNAPAGLKGVYRNPSSKKRPWKTSIVIEGKITHLGTFSRPIDAHRTYCIAALKHYGEFHNFGTNSPFTGWSLEDFEKRMAQRAKTLAA